MVKIISLFKRIDWYKSIEEMPIHNWLKLQETNDIGWIIKDKMDCTDKELLILESQLHKLTDEFIDTFGISDEYRSILELKRDLRLAEIDFALTGDKTKLAFIEIKRQQLNLTLSRSQNTEKVNVKVRVSKYLPYQIDFKKMSVKEFYEVLEEMKREAKKTD